MNFRYWKDSDWQVVLYVRAYISDSTLLKMSFIKKPIFSVATSKT